MHKVLLGLGLLLFGCLGAFTELRAVEKPKSSTLFSPEDFALYVEAKNTLAIWLSSTINPKNMPKTNEKWQNYERLVREIEDLGGESESYFGAKLNSLSVKNKVPIKIAKMIVLIKKVERVVPEIEKAEQLCQDKNSRSCEDLVRSILTNFQIK